MITGLHTIINAKRIRKHSIPGHDEITQSDEPELGKLYDDVYANEGSGMTIW